jgi:hypothetical protein
LLKLRLKADSIPSALIGATKPWARYKFGTTAIAVSLFWRSPGGFSTLAGVAVLFSNPWLLLAGWVHYLAFDLLIGSWEVGKLA